MNQRQIVILVLKSISTTFGFLAGLTWSQVKDIYDPLICLAGLCLTISVLSAFLEPT